MKTEIVKAKDSITSKWSGGTTTQVFIYPRDAEYKMRNFKFRLSKATAIDETSVYTKLPDVLRYLVSLENTAIIEHKDRYSVILEPFSNVDCFMGDWTTYAHGAISDFNLMLSNGAKGEMVVVSEKKQILQTLYSYVAFYTTEKVKIEDENNEYELEAGDTILYSEIDRDTAVKLCCNDTAIIRCNIVL